MKADKIAATTQKAIEDRFRPYLVAVQQLQAAHQANEAPEAGTLDDLLLLGKCLANASVFCEQNRVKAALAILKPGSEDLFGQQLKQPLLNTQAVAALQSMRDTEKLATKLQVVGTQSAGRGRQQQNSRSGGRQAAAPGPQQQPAAAPRFGKGKGRGRGGRKDGRR